MGRNDSVILTNDMQIIELDSFVTAFPVQPGKESATKRRFMTLFAADEQVQVGGTSYVCKVQSFTGETFALKRLLTASMLPTDANMTPEDRARITRGHAAAFYEEYKNQLLVSHMRGFPKLYGYGTIGDDPAIIMEWVEGVSVRDIARRRFLDGPPIATHTIAEIGIAVLEALDGIERLDNTLAHRDISPANIMVRTNKTSLEDQIAAGSFDICLIDFGSASAYTPEDASFTIVSQVWRNGTPEYAPPEMLTQDIPHIDKLRKSPAIDVFALCSVLYELYAGHTPWRIGEHPETSPFRLKTEHSAEELEVREQADAPFVYAIMSGLAVDQSERPSVHDLLKKLRIYDAPYQPETASAGDMAGGEADKGRDVRPTLRERVLPVGLYTPDSTKLEVARVADGGKRAGEDIPAFQKPKGITRRSLIVGGIALAAAAIAGGGIVASLAPKPSFDFSGYPSTDVIWDGGSLYPAMQLSDSSWSLYQTGTGARAPLGTDREPGRFCCGLIKVHDAASDRYGFMTAAGSSSAGDLSSAWAILPAFANAGDFSQTDFVAAVQDAESGLWGYADVHGNKAIAAAYSEASAFGSGYAAVREQGSTLWKLIDVSGAEKLAPRFLQLGTCSEEGLMAAAEQSTARWGFVGLDGSWAIPETYPQVRRFSERLAACLMDDERGLWGYIATDGSAVIEARYSDARPFADGLAPAKDPKTQLWGLIDTTGAWHVEPRYLSLGEKTGDLFPAHGSPANSYDMDDKSGAWAAYWSQGNGDPFMAYGYIDTDGNWAFKPSFGDTLIRQSEQ